jgi:hypothetical protein
MAPLAAVAVAVVAPLAAPLAKLPASLPSPAVRIQPARLPGPALPAAPARLPGPASSELPLSLPSPAVPRGPLALAVPAPMTDARPQAAAALRRLAEAAAEKAPAAPIADAYDGAAPRREGAEEEEVFALPERDLEAEIGVSGLER